MKDLDTREQILVIFIVILMIMAITIGLILYVLYNQDDTAKNKEIVTNTSSEISSRFNEALTAALDEKHGQEMKALAEQKTILSELSTRVSALETQKTDISFIKEEISKFVAKGEEKPVFSSTPKDASQTTPLRSVNLTYAIDNSWDFTEEIIYNHLLQEHDYDALGYDLESMKIIHDNLHAGYPALGSGPVQQYQSTYYYSMPQRSRGFRGIFTNSNCVGGNCN